MRTPPSVMPPQGTITCRQTAREAPHRRRLASFPHPKGTSWTSITCSTADTPANISWSAPCIATARRRAGAFFQQPGEAKLTLSCQLRKPASEAGHWYAVIVDKHGRQVEEGYLGTIDGDNEHTLASDGANHYSIKGYLDFCTSNAWKPAARRSLRRMPGRRCSRPRPRKRPWRPLACRRRSLLRVGLRPLRSERAQTTIPRSANACAIRPSPTYPRPTANQSPLVPFPS